MPETYVILPIKIIFLLGFTLHNIEEAVWLPAWSKYAKRYHATVETSEFIFAVLVVTIFGYLITALDIIYGAPENFFNYAYLGFLGMMGINAFFPHLISTLMLKKYAPGLITGLCLNLPLSVFIIFYYIKTGISVIYLIISIILVSGIILRSLKYLFNIGGTILNTDGTSGINKPGNAEDPG